MTDRAGEFGAIYLPSLRRIRDLWLEIEPLVADASYDDAVDPTELRIELSDGLLAADAARFDVQWSERGNYTFHYTDEEGLNWRFDRHPNDHAPRAHFHPPPDAADSERSCIEVEEVSLVGRAVHVCWRAAYDGDDPGRLNAGSNPP